MRATSFGTGVTLSGGVRPCSCAATRAPAFEAVSRCCSSLVRRFSPPSAPPLEAAGAVRPGASPSARRPLAMSSAATLASCCLRHARASESMSVSKKASYAEWSE